MVGLLGMSKDDTVKAVVVVKLGEYREVQPCGIHLGMAAKWSVGRATRSTAPACIVQPHLLTAFCRGYAAFCYFWSLNATDVGRVWQFLSCRSVLARG